MTVKNKGRMAASPPPPRRHHHRRHAATPSASKAQDLRLGELYARANDLLSSGTIGHEVLRQLHEVEREAAELLRQRKGAGGKERGEKGKGKGKGAAKGYVPYPDLDDEQLFRVLSRKRELLEHREPALTRAGVAAAGGLEGLWASSCSPGQYELTGSQLLLRNLVSPRTPYNGMLLFHDVGVGKTCAAITIAEQFESHKVLVLTRQGLRDGFRKQIFDIDAVRRREDGSLDYDVVTQCTGTRYTDRIRDRNVLSSEAVDRKVQRMISSRYEFMGLIAFALYVERYGHGDAADERLRRRFSDTVVIVDEAHHLRSTRGQDNKLVTPALRRVLRCADNVKLLLLTATPMFNEASDLVDLLNLLRANDKRRPVKRAALFDGTGSLTSDGEAELVASARGYVSFARASPFSFPVQLRPSINGDRAATVPVRSVDIRGRPIPPAERMRALELLCSGMGERQRAAYRAAEQSVSAYLQNAGVTAEEALADDEDREAEEEATSLQSALEICNVAYPVSSGKPYGREGFDGCFRAVAQPAGGRLLRVEYRSGLQPFLAGRLLASHAPKIAAVLERVLRCDGVALVYSRFVWSGLVPLAIALEHAGFTHMDGAALLASGGKAGRLRYAVISGERAIASDPAATLAALAAAENVDGSLIKVVLVSDKGSEGHNMRHVREVHLLDPWYHLNKVSQIVGRASRHCSHVLLPLEKRNVTVYMHALVDGGARETIDLRAYRIAEQKQARIRRVEEVLQSCAVDCALMRERNFLDPTALGITTDLLTSQGTIVKGHRLASAPASVGIGARRRCVGDRPDRHDDDPPRADESTYDPIAHTHGLQTYQRLLREAFSGEARYEARYEQLWELVSQRMGGAARRESLSLALDDLVRGRRPLMDAQGRLGSLQHRSHLYVFQPEEAGTEALTDYERSQPTATTTPERRLIARGAPSSLPASHVSRHSAAASASSAAVRDMGSVDAAVRTRLQAAAERLKQVPRTLVTRLQNALLDAVVDRLDARELLRAAVTVLVHRGEGSLTEIERRVLDSLVRGGVIGGMTSGADAITVLSPFDGRLYCYDPEAHHLRLCQAARPAPPPEAERKAQLLAVVQAIPTAASPAPAGMFKVVGVTGAQRSGCVCHQTSRVTSQDIMRMATAVAPLLAGLVGIDKRSLCELYELLLRRHRPDAILRPVATMRWREASRGKKK
jgi:hypothetical protein